MTAETTLLGRVRELVEGANHCAVATIGPDGVPHVRPVWVDTDGTYVLLNGVRRRIWVRNLRRDPRVTCLVVSRDDPYEYVQLRGRVVERTAAGADEHAERLARRYAGESLDAFARPGEERLILKIAVERLVHRPGRCRDGGAMRTPRRGAMRTPRRGAMRTPRRGAMTTPRRGAMRTPRGTR